MLRYTTQLPEEARAERNRRHQMQVPEFVVEASVSVGLYLDLARAAGEQDIVVSVEEALQVGEQRALVALHDWLRPGGVAQLDVSTIHHQRVEGYPDASRPHLHIEIGPEATTADGRRVPVNLGLLRQAGPVVQVTFHRTVEAEIEKRTPARFVAASTPTRWEIAGLAEAAVQVGRRHCRRLPLQTFPLDRLA